MITNILSIFFLLTAFLFHNMKFIKFFNFVSIFILILIVAFNRQNNDFAAYEDIFINPEGYSEIGYIYLIQILKFLGATSHVNVLITLSALMFITFIRLSYILDYIFVLVILYFIFLLPIDITQVRYTFAILFLLNSIIDFTKKRYYVALLYLIVGFSIHYFSFILVTLILLSLFNFKNIYLKTFILFVIGLFFLTLLINYFNLSVLDIRTLNNYFSEFKIKSIFIWGIPVIVSIVVLNYFKVKSSINSNSTYYFFILIMNISIVSLIFLSGLFYLYEFNRLYRTIFMLQNIAGTLLLSYLSLKNKILLFIYLFIINLLFGLYYSLELNYDYIYWGFIFY